MTSVFLPFNGQPDSLTAALFQTPLSGISLVGGSVTYFGAVTAAATYDLPLNGGRNTGILLTTGDGTPPNVNTQPNYSIAHLTPGDADLDAIIQNAFPGAGATQDASVLSFRINADPGIKSIAFDVIFLSDEFPEYSNTSFVDIAAILVNGKNAAFFSGNTKRPLSVLDDNLGYFGDNTGGGIGAIEYDGFTRKLTVIARVKEGINDIKIAIADTGDPIYDSGILVSNVRGSTQDIAGILNNISGTGGADTLQAVKGIDNILFGDLGADKLIANNGQDFFNGDLDPESGTGTMGKAAPVAGTIDEVSAGDIFKDTFIFKKVKFLEKKIDQTDVITDFDKKDVIDVSSMARSKFEFIGGDDFSDRGDPEIRYKQVKSKDYTAVYFDTEGDGKTDASLKLLGLHKLKEGDFDL